MKTLTVQEIVEYAIRIEEESFRFYRSAGTILVDEHALEVVHMLADEEMKHVNWLRDLVQKPEVSSSEMDEVIIIGNESLESMIHTNQVNAAVSKHEILNRALEREKKTRDLYDSMYEMATMSVPVRDMFRILRDQEQEHVGRVKALISNSEQA
jgi:rubrerythrin